MLFFELRNSAGKDVGTYPQTNGMSLDFNNPQDRTVASLPNFEKPDFEPNIDYFILDKKSKITDFISTAAINATGFIVSNKVKNILLDFQLPDCLFIPLRILAKNEFYSYNWLHFYQDLTPALDFSKMEFELKSSITSTQWQVLESNIYFSSFDDLIKKHSEKEVLDQLFPRDIFLQTGNFQPHILTFEYLKPSVLISAQLLQTFLKENITGYEITNKPFEVTFA